MSRTITNQYVGSPEVSCHGKKSWVTKVEAKRSIRRLRSANMTKGPRKHRLMAYRCPHCQSFHIGHRP